MVWEQGVWGPLGMLVLRQREPSLQRAPPPGSELVEAWCRLSLFQTWLAGAGRALSEVRTSWLPDSSQLTFGRRARQGNGFKEITSQERKVAEERSPVLSLTSQDWNEN
ncbi:unnamed protein product [Rangifer tarandus platyrhynchus]|uniref:Uncharacterized protein n=2 Tax=Rangifer tarandus platyrhynchus TaxID=3082113 RepID=A0ABN8Z8T6_RANTA|nr:unnamed protein product [Rangifer tarandus platyrhynchus]